VAASGMRNIFLLYNFVSLLLGTAATAVVLVLYLKSRNRRVMAYLWADFFVALIVAVVTLDLYWSIADYTSMDRIPIWNIIHFSCCGLCFWIPRTCRRDEASHRERIIERIFQSALSWSRWHWLGTTYLSILFIRYS